MGTAEIILERIQEPKVLDEALRRVLRQALQEPPAPRKMTYEEFLAWADEDSLAEWVDGEAAMHSPASDQHQDVVRFMSAVLSVYTESHQLGIIRPAPFQMRLSRSGREPDLLFLAKEHLSRLAKTHLDGPADLVVEILSPESAVRDRGEKFYEYEEAGITEYWLLDPDRERAEFYQLDAQGRYAMLLPDAEGVYRSKAIPGFRLRVQWLWQPPPVLSALRDLGLI
ncbi:MAG: Uma2 family endonuclease [Chloroflexi bacterium]|nr:Uma2 family endonuclease [Chloroflexota bacterium]